MKSILLHVCCAPCATHSIALLLEEYDVTLFFSNSNIYPKTEYLKRLDSAKKIAAEMDAELIVDSYDHADWLNWINGLESEPEKGARCLKCFEFNLSRTAEYASNNNFDYFTTTLTISPHKSSKTIFDIGGKFNNLIPVDFKKRDCFKHSI